MDVIRAEAMGLCFGVRQALEYVAAVGDPTQVTVYGELVHNETVNRGLARRGFRRLDEQRRGQALPETPIALITAHGVSDTERARLRGAGLRLMDTTCPLVRRAHDAALGLQSQGCYVLVIGRRGHVEVQGLIGDLPRAEVVESATEVRCYHQEKIGVLCQTTSTEAVVRAVLEAVTAMNPGSEIRFVDTVCRPTRERQQALDRLLPLVDALVVVGGRKSRNTRELAESARARGVPAYRVESAAEVDFGWFQGCRAVGLTAGTSALDETIEEVHRALLLPPGAGFQVSGFRTEMLSTGQGNLYAEPGA
jgi:4-hydroxy-3-methylbut-2-enyl diphosphate reductase